MRSIVTVCRKARSRLSVHSTNTFHNGTYQLSLTEAVASLIPHAL